MPCTFTGSIEGDVIESLRESLKNSSDKHELLKKELDRATRLLCSLTKQVPQKYLKDPEIAEWVDEHRKLDERRIAKEIAAKRKAREEARLCKEEKAVGNKKFRCDSDSKNHASHHYHEMSDGSIITWK
jgi:hypothetical protein